jgi:hypothetical protein
MPTPPSRIISIAANQDQTPLSKAQKTFNTLTKQIQAKRAALAAWQEAIPAYQQKYASELSPLIETLRGLHIEIVHCLDSVSEQKGMTSSERRMLDELISQMAGDLAAEQDDAGLINLYNKHSGSDYEEEQAAALKGMKSLFEAELGVDLGDDLDIDSHDELLRRAQARLHEQQAQRETARQAEPENQPSRKKTAKQLAKEAKLEAEAQQLSQSIKEVFRKLVSALHPDREPDPEERQRKTALMQRVNQAYDKKNLLLLLELQLELEHIDQATIDNISDDRLKHFNKILKEQLGELDQEIFHTEDMFMAQFGYHPYDYISPSTIMRHLDADIAETKRTIRNLKKDLLEFKDLKKVKAWLKDMRRRPKRDFSDDF